MNEFAGKGAYGVAAAYATVLILVATITVQLFNFLISHIGTGHKVKDPSKKKGE